jgi:hypothetical protein
VETFFKTLKSELVWRTIFYTRQQATQAIGRYIDGWTCVGKVESSPMSSEELEDAAATVYQRI